VHELQQRYEAVIVELVEACHRLAELGFAISHGGNVSCRTDGGDILITPTKVAKGRVTFDRVVILDHAGTALFAAGGAVAADARCARSPQDSAGGVFSVGGIGRGVVFPGQRQDNLATCQYSRFQYISRISQEEHGNEVLCQQLDLWQGKAGGWF
jgi:hypothetical protein